MEKTTQLIANGRVFTFIRRRTRRTLKLHIKPDQTVVVTAPWLIASQVAIQFVIQHESWIQKQLTAIQIKKEKQPRYTFQTGDTLYYLGQPYTLIVTPAGTRTTIRLNTDQIIIATQNSHPDHINSALTKWYKSKAKDIFEDRIGIYAQRVGQTPKQLRLSSARTRWGSCSPTGTISLRWTLIMAPLRVLDYVVIHELCHLVHMNHSPSFWKLVKAIDPDYKDAENHLKRDGIRYHPLTG